MAVPCCCAQLVLYAGMVPTGIYQMPMLLLVVLPRFWLAGYACLYDGSGSTGLLGTNLSSGIASLLCRRHQQHQADEGAELAAVAAS
jgi:hypothetical protein